MAKLEGKKTIVTGGASGIGAATAARFIDEGALVCIWDRDEEAGAKVSRELPALSGLVMCDVSDHTQVQTSLEKTVALMGGVDVLINNAGISIRHNFLDITPEEWAKVLDVNLNGVFYVAQATARHMMERDGGVILNTASTNGAWWQTARPQPACPSGLPGAR